MKRKKSNKIIYRIDHYYFMNSEVSNEGCLLIEVNKNVEDLADIITAIEFRFAELIGEELSIDIEFEHLLEILVKLFSVKNVKEEFNHILKETDSDHEGEEINDYAVKYELDDIEVIKIDSYFSWEYHCGYNYREIIEKYINQDIDKYILEFKEYYLNLNEELRECLGK